VQLLEKNMLFSSDTGCTIFKEPAIFGISHRLCRPAQSALLRAPFFVALSRQNIIEALFSATLTRFIFGAPSICYPAHNERTRSHRERILQHFSQSGLLSHWIENKEPRKSIPCIPENVHSPLKV